MFWEMILGAVIAGGVLCLCWLAFGRLLSPSPMEGRYVLFVRPEERSKLEQQLRGCQWARQTGLMRGKICVVVREPGLEEMLQACQKQGLIDEIWTEDRCMER